MMKFAPALAALASLAAAPAMAEDRGFYVGFDIGQYTWDLDQGSLDRQAGAALEAIGLTELDGTSEVSDDGLTWGIIVGYQVFRFLAVEAAYIDLGEVEYKRRSVVSDGFNTADAAEQLTAESAGPALSAVGILPFMKRWQVYARGGVYFASNDASARLSSDGLSAGGRDSSSSQEFFWGAGAGYSNEHWTTRVEYQLFTNVGDGDTFDGVDADRIVIGAVYRY